MKTEHPYRNLIRRLRGEYRIPITDNLGPVQSSEEPDNPNEFVRTFETPPINKEAADAIEDLLSQLSTTPEY